jgi:hypothetical protein
MAVSTIDSNSLNAASDLVINGVTVGKGTGSVSTNTLVGAGGSLGSNTTGANNTAVGYNSSSAITTGIDNVSMGYNSLSSNATGSNNTAIGRRALYTNTASDNTAVGYWSLTYNTTGTANTAVGRDALNANTTASNNTAVGYQAGYTGSTTANGTFVGYQAGYLTTGASNVCVGMQSGSNISTGAGNAIFGTTAGGQMTTGTHNTFIGSGIQGTNGGAGFYVTTGSKNTILGRYDGNTDGLDIRTASNYVVLSDGDGNRAAYWQSGGGWVQKNNSTSWSTYSDQRIKENIVAVSNGLSVITALRPVEFDYKIGDKKHDIGFIAQEYKNVLPNQIHETTSGGEEIQALTNGEPLLSIQQNLVPYLVSAIKELKTIVDAQAAEIAELKAKVA